MSRTEKYGTRSIAWSIFHRSMPPPAYMIDMDYIECCRYCKQPLIIGELARDIGQTFKPTTILLKIAQRASIHGILIFYNEDLILEKVRDITGLDSQINIPTLTKDELAYLWRHFSQCERPLFRVKHIFPTRINDEVFTAKEYFEFLERIHQDHEIDCIIKKQIMPMLAKSN